ncbi:hypothetical protein acsn021_32660 [Anaerocolumna cellulosilytica]|uniref:Uncharacterized protein n=1 Tax=Anaerocolumna cellulosilytica TaxID=433286 RepID=A0A6S6R6R4_9FIRM|nr:hypothetical protein [Anaerocolumna cellulosilytica]MBB5196597.1 hypothetical protein [Anaerocolumna cellulosilytica]BCJ95697.1 hypothetical protein acsn021_32660 [Anaerocolumna cellulosilytica]
MKTYFICNNCGNIIDYNSKDFDEILDDICNRVHTCTCGEVLTMDNSYPTLSAQDFIFSADLLFGKSKEIDKKILNEIHDIIQAENYVVDNTRLDKYLNKYEEIKERYPDNNKAYYLTISDEFDSYLVKQENDYDMVDIISLNMLLSRNRFRKPYVIMALSIIEQLFNNYFTKLSESKLSPFGASTFIKAYDTSGIQSCLNIIDSLLNEELKNKMDNYLLGFYDRWATFRKIRNDIIHSNSKYISKITLKKVQKLLDDSIDVFANLKSELYKNNKG